MITAFSHDTAQSSDQDSAGAENNMTIAYEAVHYDIGSTRSGRVKGFAVDHYDKTPSPLSAAGGGTSTLFGPGGVIEGASDILTSLANGTAFDNPANFLSTAITTVNTYQNAKGLTKAGLAVEGTRLLTAGAIAAVGVGLSGIKNVVIPGGVNTNTTTVATQVDFGP